MNNKGKEKPVYQTPIVVPLGEMEAAFGDCTVGSANSSGCNVGTQVAGISGQCLAGFSAGGACEVGNSAGSKCENGALANVKCEMGSAAAGKCETGSGRIS